jgi:hypothetical protein
MAINTKRIRLPISSSQILKILDQNVKAPIDPSHKRAFHEQTCSVPIQEQISNPNFFKEHDGERALHVQFWSHGD